MLKFNPPPNWPAAPEDFVPGPEWRPKPEWGPAPAGWHFWVDSQAIAADMQAPEAAPNRISNSMAVELAKRQVRRAGELGRRASESENLKKAREQAGRIAKDERTKAALKFAGILAIELAASRSAQRFGIPQIESIASELTGNRKLPREDSAAADSENQKLADERPQPPPDQADVPAAHEQKSPSQTMKADASRLFSVSLAEIRPMCDLWRLSLAAFGRRQEPAELRHVSTQFWILLNTSSHPAAKTSRALFKEAGCELSGEYLCATIEGHQVKIVRVEKAPIALAAECVRLIIH